MTEDQIQLVRDSFAQVEPIAPAAAELFYGRLFALDPSLQPLFKGDMAQQGVKLMSAIGTVVAHLDRLSEIAPTVHELACRHVTYGVREAHYDTVGAALIWTLEQGLGAGFTPAVRAGWIECYGLVAAEMKRAAATAEAAARPDGTLPA
jgi:hemoglobin-like flavoprotein